MRVAQGCNAKRATLGLGRKGPYPNGVVAPCIIRLQLGAPLARSGTGALGTSSLYHSCHKKNDNNNEANYNSLDGQQPDCAVYADSCNHADQKRDYGDDDSPRRRYHRDPSLT